MSVSSTQRMTVRYENWLIKQEVIVESQQRGVDLHPSDQILRIAGNMKPSAGVYKSGIPTLQHVARISQTLPKSVQRIACPVIIAPRIIIKLNTMRLWICSIEPLATQALHQHLSNSPEQTAIKTQNLETYIDTEYYSETYKIDSSIRMDTTRGRR